MYYTANTQDIAVRDTQADTDHPAGYRPDAGLVDAVNVALVLNRPILLTGEPGTGKSQAAFSAAWQLAARKQLNVSQAAVEKFETKSTSVSRDLFYSFDTLGRFHAVQAGGSQDNKDYLSYNALGRALINALPAADVASVLPEQGFAHEGPRRSVVLIDEIDKAPRDFPNDLLNEIDQMYFRIPELRNATVGGPKQLRADLRPIVFITSNSEKQLPDPFLRRCIYYHIPFPDAERLGEILLARLPGLGAAGGALSRDALEFFLSLRERNLAKRRISPAELLQWVSYLLQRGAKSSQRLREVREHAHSGLSALVKDPGDHDRVKEALNAFLG